MNQENLNMNEPARGGLKPLHSILSLDGKFRVYSHLSCLVRLKRTLVRFPLWCGSFGQV